LLLEDVNAGDHFGDCVLHLDARVDLDEVELAAFRVRQELDGAGMSVAYRPHQPKRGGTQGLAVFVLQGAGARSTTFWLRRCTVQSRS